MKILALDTSGDACSVALYDARNKKLLAEERVLIERGHAEILFSQIACVTEQGDTSLKSIDRFAVTIGPGTFTGVRIGLSAARGFALAAQKPLIGLSSLEVVARGAEAPASAIIVAAFDARRGEIYVQAFQGDATILEPMAATPAEAASAITEASSGGEVFIIGTGAEILRAALASKGARAEIAPGEALPRADVLARLAANRPAATEPVMPLYLRAPDAKLPTRS
ncbi:MAG: tRNA (adenosine(37)-N6)-threonylcarbamoyltransferase complex dimerization subunit type 1 TsaB [Alphaproteobacteria bacterium]